MQNEGLHWIWGLNSPSQVLGDAHFPPFFVGIAAKKLKVGSGKEGSQSSSSLRAQLGLEVLLSLV